MAGEMGNYLPAINLGTNTAIAISASHYNTCVILNDNNMMCWGDNSSGQLGQGHTNLLGDEPNELGDYLPPINFGSGELASDCTDSSPTTSPTLSPSISFAPSYSTLVGCKTMFCGEFHSCFLSSQNKLKCLGLNNFGQLAYGDTINRGDNVNETGSYLPSINISSTNFPISLYSGDDNSVYF